jgi:hypothetical protein
MWSGSAPYSRPSSRTSPGRTRDRPYSISSSFPRDISRVAATSSRVLPAASRRARNRRPSCRRTSVELVLTAILLTSRMVAPWWAGRMIIIARPYLTPRTSGSAKPRFGVLAGIDLVCTVGRETARVPRGRRGSCAACGLRTLAGRGWAATKGLWLTGQLSVEVQWW